MTLINAFSVPLTQAELFLRRWRDNARLMAAAEGFVRARMFQAVSDRAELTFVNVAEWSNGTALDSARTNPAWVASIQRMIGDPELDVTARPMVYNTALDVAPGDLLP
ncbi:antibiotic biosynthesis monooxygenase family protein [Amycolatopsis sp. H20-H5]|uniref:antibiotic biosynthesis monooxygenase family protein n=1 Tax=Amycolatopsis sp. H20-H5 TaxID=3046309 RepID=UPI002DBEDE65|nr:antibiotic biosynthesis monooxygenase family protein [Amycolatopsis sp. H20-H5]MEC3975523.1 antibiotic biosynthesis monooxygenase family protein [Amycolatopsis sp. H20-H5]